MKNKKINVQVLDLKSTTGIRVIDTTENISNPILPILEKPKRLTDFESTLLWMAIRYAMNRQTIASAMLPQDIIKNYYHRLSKIEREMIVKDLKDNEENWSFTGKAFGHETIDRPQWIKFWKALDSNCHYEVELIDGSKCTVFEVEGQIIPLDKYIEFPNQHYFLPIENIKSKIEE